MKKLKGQVLLGAVMIIATLMTVILAITFQSTTETQTTKLEQENQKALAAAEAAIEAALKGNTNVVIGQGDLTSLTGFSGSATISTATTNFFTSPTITKDSSYTFYLGDYDATTNTIGTSLSQDVTICFNNDTNNAALEITLVKTDGIKKYLVDPDSRISNASSGSSGCSYGSGGLSDSYTVSAADIGTTGQLLLVRAIYSQTKVLIGRVSDLPIQGKTVTSEAKSATGVSKKIILFQSYPQVPAEFYTTSF